MATNQSLPSSSEPLGPLPGPRPGASPTGVAAGANVPPPRVQLYNFQRPNRFSKELLRTLQTIHEQFARNLASSLSTYLRLNVRIQVDAVEQAAFDEYVELLPNPAIIYVLNLGPLGGPIIVEQSISPTRVMLDRLCGGPGMVTSRSQHLTEIERSLLRPLGRHLLRTMDDAWSPVIQLKPSIEDVLLNPRAARTVVPNDVVAVVSLDLGVGDVVGRMSLCLPHLALEPVLDKLNARVWSLDQQRLDQGESEHRLREQLLGVPLTATAELGEIDVPAATLLSLRAGDIVRLGTPVHGELLLSIAGRPAFRCRPGLSSGRVAVQIERAASASAEMDWSVDGQ